MTDLYKSKVYKYNTTLPENRVFRDALDQKIGEVNPELDEKEHFPTNFVENFSKEFKRDFF